MHIEQSEERTVSVSQKMSGQCSAIAATARLGSSLCVNIENNEEAKNDRDCYNGMSFP